MQTEPLRSSKIRVQKFGGTSVGDIERIKKVAALILDSRASGDQIVVVCSAMAGETNRLVGLAHAITTVPYSREYDLLLASGEQVAVALLSLAINQEALARGLTSPEHGIAVPLLAHQIGIVTDSLWSRARINSIDTARLTRELSEGRIPIIAGFQGIDHEGNITTLGRGGSDTSAVAIAAALGARECEIYTDVDAVYTADPRVVPKARAIESISTEEMMELASLGAKVLHIRSVELAAKYQVPLWVKSSFRPELKGTCMSTESNESKFEQPVVTGVALARDQVKLALRGLSDRPGVAAQVFGTLARAGIDVDIIVQDLSSQGNLTLSFTVGEGDRLSAQQALTRAGFEPIEEASLAKVSIVGAGMRNHPGVAARFFDILAQANVNIKLVTTSEIKVSCLIAQDMAEPAMQAIHTGFGLDKKD